MILADTLDRRLAVCAALSIMGHFAFATGLSHLPRHDVTREKRVVSIRVLSPPPPPPPEPEPEPAPPKMAEAVTPKAVPRARPRTASVVPPLHDVHPKEVPPLDRPAAASDTAATPVFGVTMESTSQAGNGPAMRVGGGGPRRGPPAPESAEPASGSPLGEPVAAYEVTVMPLPLGRCAGKYTDEATRAGLEGTVVLNLIVGADGRTRDIHVVSGPRGLTQAAVEALKACRFSPGERDGKPVPVRLPSFKIRFLMQDNE